MSIQTGIILAQNNMGENISFSQNCREIEKIWQIPSDIAN